MEITLKKIAAYIHCPQKYDLIYNKKLANEVLSKREQVLMPYKKFLLSIVSKEPMTLDELKTHVDLAVKDESKFNKRDVETIWGKYIRLYDFFSTNKINVLSFNQKFTTRIGNNVINTMLEQPIVQFNGKSTKVALMNVIMSASISPFYEEISWYNNYILSLVNSLEPIRKLGLQYKGLETVYVSTSKTESSINVYNKDKGKRATRIIDEVCKAIDNEIYYPRVNPSCNSCEAKHFCKFY